MRNIPSQAETAFIALLFVIAGVGATILLIIDTELLRVAACWVFACGFLSTLFFPFIEEWQRVPFFIGSLAMFFFCFSHLDSYGVTTDIFHNLN